MAVVDPDPNRSKRPGAADDQVEVPITIHVAGNNTQPASLGGNAERARSNARGKVEINAVLKAIRAPAFGSGDGEVRMAITVQIGDRTALVAIRGRGGKLRG